MHKDVTQAHPMDPIDCPLCGRPVAPPVQSNYVGPAEAAHMLGVTGDEIRRLDRILEPIRGIRGNRLYQRSVVEERARAFPPKGPRIAINGDWLSFQQVVRIFGLSEQRVRDMDRILQPRRDPELHADRPGHPPTSKLGPRRYHRGVIEAELRKRGRIPR